MTQQLKAELIKYIFSVKMCDIEKIPSMSLHLKIFVFLIVYLSNKTLVMDLGGIQQLYEFDDDVDELQYG